MSWNVTCKGKKDAAKEEAIKQADTNIENGYQNEAQKALALAAIEACPGTEIDGYVAGHNERNDATGTINITLRGWTPPEEEQP